MSNPAPSWLALAIVVALTGCVESAPPAPELTPGPRTFGCVPIEEAIIGTWQREGLIEEFRGDGAYLLNGVEGAFRFRSPGYVVLDAAGIHAEHVVGLTSVNELISADESGVGHVSARVSPPPPIPDDCYDLRSMIVGTWLGSAQPQTFGRDSTWSSGDRAGAWSMPSHGHLAIRAPVSAAAVNYLVAQLSDTTALAIEASDGSSARVLTRQR